MTFEDIPVKIVLPWRWRLGLWLRLRSEAVLCLFSRQHRAARALREAWLTDMQHETLLLGEDPIPWCGPSPLEPEKWA